MSILSYTLLSCIFKNLVFYLLIFLVWSYKAFFRKKLNIIQGISYYLPANKNTENGNIYWVEFGIDSCGKPVMQEMMMSRGAYVRIISIWIWLTRDLKVQEVGRYYKMSKKKQRSYSITRKFLLCHSKDEYRMIRCKGEENVSKSLSLKFCIWLYDRIECCEMHLISMLAWTLFSSFDL